MLELKFNWNACSQFVIHNNFVNSTYNYSFINTDSYKEKDIEVAKVVEIFKQHGNPKDVQSD